MEKICSESEVQNFIRAINAWASDEESQNKSFKAFLKDEAIAGVENCTDIETGHLHIEEAKQVLQYVEDAEFVFDMLNSKGIAE